MKKFEEVFGQGVGDNNDLKYYNVLRITRIVYVDIDKLIK